jgi:abhydrolase domain-containing protein 11
VDARNHGDSPHTTQLTYNHLVEDLRALMIDLAIERATFIGHSMGGRAVMLMALRYVC